MTKNVIFDGVFNIYPHFVKAPKISSKARSFVYVLMQCLFMISQSKKYPKRADGMSFRKTTKYHHQIPSKRFLTLSFLVIFFVLVVLIEAPNIKLLKKVMQVPESAQKLREIKILWKSLSFQFSLIFIFYIKLFLLLMLFFLFSLLKFWTWLIASPESSHSMEKMILV